MNKGILYRYVGITIILLFISLYSWGSVSLPQHPYKVMSLSVELRDTIPVKNPAETAPAEQKKEPIVEPVIKEVPRAKKQLKPIAVPSTVVPVKPPKVIKPKIVIKKIGVRVP